MTAIPEIQSLNMSPEEIASAKILLRFLQQYPEQLGWRGRNVPDPSTENGKIQITTRFVEGTRKRIQPPEPSTVPDNMVSEILVSYYGYDASRTESMKLEHQHAMLAENTVGNLLELYIYSEAKHFGWVHCVSELVKKIDFVKFNGVDWDLLQVKNRDNSENSSSSAIRNGTEIKKWFRTFSRTGATNWNNFPDEDLRVLLSEDGFIEFVQNYYS